MRLPILRHDYPFKLYLGTLQTYFNTPEGDEPLALDKESMGQGQVQINGQSIGRYTAYANGNCQWSFP